jgi:glycosyltransferase involved in cell wall biosynthesis
MRILFLTHQYFPRHLGGTEMFTRGLVRRAIAAGYEVLVVTCHESSAVSPRDFSVKKTSYEGVPLFEIHQNLSVTEARSLYEYHNNFAAGHVRNIVQEFKPDIVQVMHGMKLSAASIDVCRAANIPTIVVLADFWFICPRHSLLTHKLSNCSGPQLFKCVPCTFNLHGYPEDPKSLSGLGRFFRDLRNIEKRPAALKKSLLSANRIFALSQFQKQMFVSNGYPRERIEILEHGIEPDDLQSAPPKAGLEGQTTVGFVANIVPEKGLHILISAMEMLKGEAIKLEVWGQEPEGTYVNRLRQKAKTLAVNFNGAFEPERFGAVLDGFNALAVPAVWYENNPLVVKAALYKKIPVLASALGSLPELVNEQNGFLVQGGAADWAKALRNLIGTDGRFQFQSVKTMDQTWQELLKVYKEELA